MEICRCGHSKDCHGMVTKSCHEVVCVSCLQSGKWEAEFCPCERFRIYRRIKDDTKRKRI